jgi:hypothetical protein
VAPSTAEVRMAAEVPTTMAATTEMRATMTSAVTTTTTVTTTAVTATATFRSGIATGRQHGRDNNDRDPDIEF